MSGRVYGYERFAADMRRNDSVFAAFITELAEVLPDVLAEAKVYELLEAATEGFMTPEGKLLPLDYHHIDIREQALIALLGNSTLLNRQKGGKFTSYRPSYDNQESFLKLNIKAFANLELSLLTA